MSPYETMVGVWGFFGSFVDVVSYTSSQIFLNFLQLHLQYTNPCMYFSTIPVIIFTMNATVLASLAESSNIQDLTLSKTEERALALLGQGIEPSIVAAAVGVSDSRISQLISDPHFSARVAELRYVNLAKHTQRDNAYDDIEDTLIGKLKDCIPYMMKPMEILASIRVINQAKRRGQQTLSSGHEKAEVVHLTLPISIVNQFRVDTNNQVIQAGQQDLITIQAGAMKNLLQTKKSIQTESQNVELLSTSSKNSNSNSGTG
jgi:hypothetical protein